MTGIKRNSSIAELPDGRRVSRLGVYTTGNGNVSLEELGGRSFFELTGGKYSWEKYLDATGAKIIEGWQFRYIYFIDKSWRQKLTVPEIPFSRIDELNAGMYRGEKISMAERHIMKHGEK